MTTTIECPLCSTTFEASFDSSGTCECPNCKSVLLLDSNEINEIDYVVDFEECITEAALIKEEVSVLDDANLEDEISQEVASREYMTGTFSIFTDMETKGKLSEANRSLAEGVYILMHTVKFFGYEQ